MMSINQLNNKYKFAVSPSEIPYKYIPETVKELSDDLKEIENIIIENKNNELRVLNLCASLKSKLNKRLTFLTTKLKNIPIQKYLVESDEEWIDKNWPT